uniref:Wall-associated receptor kinase galacturonan-binding domain-containing protein n=1 Tax=Chenopodium quinoa TaxID=63459 RepID=A0A803LHT2_CHEQI
MKTLNSYPLFVILAFISSCLCRPSELDCIHHCGNIKIPYPFGIGPNHCFSDPNYAVSCNSSSSNQSIPYLKKLDLEIVEVRNSSRAVIVKLPSVTACNGTEIYWSSPDIIRSTGFSFADSNVFASVGCHGYAIFYSEATMEGCTSICATDRPKLIPTSPTDMITEQCYGFNNCCQAVNPLYYDRYSISVSAKDGSAHCRSAFLISREYFPTVASIATPMSAFPVTLHWPDHAD